jgi:hypothetical protein
MNEEREEAVLRWIANIAAKAARGEGGDSDRNGEDPV